MVVRGGRGDGVRQGVICVPQPVRAAKSSLTRPEGRIAAGGQSSLRAAVRSRLANVLGPAEAARATARRPAGRPLGGQGEALCRESKRTLLILLHIIARGKIGRSPEGELVDRYAKRLAWPVKLTEWPDTGAGKLADPLTPPCRTVLLDERGKAMTSENFCRPPGALA